MSNWRDHILNKLTPGIYRLTLVTDPDDLLTEEKLSLTLRERGFELMDYHDPIEFRYAYENRRHQGDEADFIVLLHSKDPDTLPYDLLQSGHRLTFSLAEIFPQMSYPVMEKLDKRLLDQLFQAVQAVQPENMGDNGTRDFILRHVFELAPEQLTTETDLLAALIRLHDNGLLLPEDLVNRLIQLLNLHKKWASWPLAEILPHAEAFFAFLQERWPYFLEQQASNRVQEDPPGELQFSGPKYLPFNDRSIRVYIDNLFLEGKLTPVEPIGIDIEPDSWMNCGIANKTEQRIARLMKQMNQNPPSAHTRYTEWVTKAQTWAELSALVHLHEDEESLRQWRAAGQALNEAFADWLTDHYANLITLSPTTPAMLHHIPHHLARSLEKSDGKVALIVVDGLALDQWVTLRHILRKQNKRLSIRESAVFAWIPTITSISRQAIFAGKPPFYFPDSLHTTNNEEKWWKQLWENNGLNQHEVVYQRGLGDGSAEQELDKVINPNTTKVVGLVVDKADKIMHGMQLGAAGMHNQLKQWGESGFLNALISYLLNADFEVWLTSDHGNISCEGMGRLATGRLAETRGERVRIYPDPELRAREAANCPLAYEWPPIGLPDGCFPLLAKGNAAFVNQGNSLVSHGGMTMEEVIVPLIKLEYQTRS